VIRRRAVPSPTVPPALRRLLEEGTFASTDDLGGMDRLALHLLARPGADRSVVWAAHRAEIMAGWIDARAGTRPAEWWCREAPEPRRRRLGGVGAAAHEVSAVALTLDFGIPRAWTAIDPADPPTFESQATYLRRHGLLTPEERARLTAGAFKPETVEPDHDDDEEATDDE
jgi:hypothetical protein